MVLSPFHSPRLLVLHSGGARALTRPFCLAILGLLLAGTGVGVAFPILDGVADPSTSNDAASSQPETDQEDPAQTIDDAYRQRAEEWQKATGLRDGEFGSGTGPWYQRAADHFGGALPATALAGTTILAAGALVPLGGGRRWWNFVPFLPGYSRLKPNEVLGQETRIRVFATVEQRPGVTFSDLKRHLGLSTGVLTHHLQMLEKHNLIRSQRVGPWRTFHRAGLRVEEPKEPLTQAQIRFLEALHPSVSVNRIELASRLGVTPQAISHHAKVLAQRGLVKAEYQNGQLLCRLPEPNHVPEASQLVPPLPSAAA